MRRTVSSLLALLAVHYRDGNCNVECRVLYLGGPECAKITLQKSGSRGHSPTTPSITWCLPLVDTLEHAKTSSTNVQFNVTIVIIIFVIYVIHTRILLASSYTYIHIYVYLCLHTYNKNRIKLYDKRLSMLSFSCHFSVQHLY